MWPSNNIYSLIYLPKTNSFKKFSQPLKALVFYKDHYLNLLTGEKKPWGLDALDRLLADQACSEYSETAKFFHLTYEYGLNPELYNGNTLLGSFFQYEKDENYVLRPGTSKLFYKVIRFPQKHDYEKRFFKIQEHLQRGDSYQVNLTMPFEIEIAGHGGPEQLINLLWRQSRVGAYAHATYLGPLNQLFFSNTPECLFELKGDYLRTRPIKGTVRSSEKGGWHKLSSSEKDQAELYMITDLLRNDLNSIAGAEAVVLAKKQKLNVSGLVHQYSLIEKRLKPGLTAKDLLKHLLPGGSITGAPKKRTTEIIKDVEIGPRGYYTGSTMIFHRRLRASSLNIRSAYIDFAKSSLSYNAGGGITLLSNCDQEYDEMLAKWESFESLLL